jgi:hypothetical protein
MKLFNLRCVTDITAHQHDKKVIFTACSDAPHKSSFRKIVARQTRSRSGTPDKEVPCSIIEDVRTMIGGGSNESTQGGIFHA